MGNRVHTVIRSLTKYLPYMEVGGRILNDDLNIVLGRLFFDKEEPHWMVSDAEKGLPALELNVSTRLQRKLFYFHRAWGRHWLNGPLARLMKSTLVPGETFVDIGANLGIYSMHAAGLVGSEGCVIAFEPDPEIFESLRRSSALNGPASIRCENLALSDRTSTCTFYRSWHGGANSLVPQDGRYKGSIEVPVETFDEYVARTGTDVSRVRLMKIDVEGEEARTVAGMIGVLRKAAWPDLWIEVRGPKGSTRAPDTFAGVLQTLAPLGYGAFRWLDGRMEPVSKADVVYREDILFSHSTRANG